jgi:hypothetical protein
MPRAHHRAEIAMTCRRLVVLLAAAASATACGSSSPSSSHPSPTARPSGPAQPEESRSAQQIYDDSLAAVAQQRSAHITGHQVDTAGTAVDVDVVDTAQSARVTLRAADGTIYLVVTPGAVFVSGSASGPYRTAPTDLATEASSLTLEATVRCGRIEHGALTKGAISTVNGIRVIAIEDDGKAPGASPSTTYIALSGPPLLVRVVARGATTPGGSIACGHSPNDTGPPTVSATYDFGDWGAPVTVTPPPGGSSGPAV